ncbi:MAG: DUF1269 domain-containing protein [Myxococcota bacterium]|nr:DUF1269 domain-containing protein [Myxococcota bacterium]
MSTVSVSGAGAVAAGRGASGASRQIVALAFDTPARAHEAMQAATRLQEQELLSIHDAVYVTRHDEGPAEVTTSLDAGPVAAAVPSSLFGALVGTLVAGPVGFLIGGVLAGGCGSIVARLVESGIPQRIIGELEALTRPNQTVLALLISDIAGGAVIEELRRFRGAHVVYSQLPPVALELVRQAIGDRPET